MFCVVYVRVFCCLYVYSSVFVVLYPDVLSEGLMECSLTLDVVLRFCLCFVVFFALLCYHQLPLLCCVMLFCPKDCVAFVCVFRCLFVCAVFPCAVFYSAPF